MIIKILQIGFFVFAMLGFIGFVILVRNMFKQKEEEAKGLFIRIEYMKNQFKDKGIK